MPLAVFIRPIEFEVIELILVENFELTQRVHNKHSSENCFSLDNLLPVTNFAVVPTYVQKSEKHTLLSAKRSPYDFTICTLSEQKQSSNRSLSRFPLCSQKPWGCVFTL